MRLVGPHRVEVHEKGTPMRLVYPGELLAAPGILRNPEQLRDALRRAVGAASTSEVFHTSPD